MNMTEDGRDSSPTEVTTNSAINKAPEKKVRNRPLTKIVIRRLPPTMTEEAFLEQVSPVPEYDYFYFVKPDMTLGPCAFSRAYINFINIEDIYLFKEKFDGYVFVDEKGVEYVGVVEYAPFQRIPKMRRRKDPKSGTIETDPIFQEFLESLNETKTESREPKLEYSYPINDGNDKRVISTPLLDFLASRKSDKKTRDERRRREADRRKPRLDRRNKEGTIKMTCSVEAYSLPTPSTSHVFDLKTEHNATSSILEIKEEWSAGNEIYACKKNNSLPNRGKKMVHVQRPNSILECHFPALPMRHNTFTLPNNCDNLSEVPKSHLYSSIMMSQSCGDNLIMEEEEIEETDIKKIKVRDWEKHGGKKNEDDENNSPKKVNSDSRDGKNTTPKGKPFKEQRKTEDPKKKYNDKIDSSRSKDWNNDGDKLAKREKKEKMKEPPKEQKTKEVKRYSDTRKERIKLKADEETTEGKPKLNSDIKPFTQLPNVKTEDLSKVIEAMDRNVNKQSINKKTQNEPKDEQSSECEREPSERQNINNNNTETVKNEIAAENYCSSEKDCVQRCSSLEADSSVKEDNPLRRHKSLEDNVEEDNGDKNEDDSSSQDAKKERRIRNKDRPTLAIYKPGMGRFSKQRIIKETDKPETTKPSKDT